MIASFVITFREALEAALIVGIVLGYLARTKQTRYNTVVYLAIAAAVAASIAGALLFTRVAGGFTGRAEEIFEGVTMLVGAGLLTTMILWMMKQRPVAAELRERVATEIAQAHVVGLFSLVFVSVLREGIETVIFLGAASFVSADSNLIGALAGLLAAVVLGYLIFAGSMRLDLRRFFTVTSILLILFAAGLVAHGVHELQEAGVIPVLVEHVWDINPALNPDGSYPLLHENGFLGSVLKALVGYNGNPSLLEVMSYLGYLVLVSVLWRRSGGERKAAEPAIEPQARPA
jgi:high-affinity iron transporter